MNEQTSRLKAGDELGTAVIRDFIGRGRDTEVYLAFAPDLKQEVAIKTLRYAAPPTADLAACFREDMESIAGVKHPNIARIYSFDVSEDRYYIVMELIQGTGLRDLISSYPAGLDRDETVRIFSQLASAVATAHDHKVVHGNIKPDNVLFDAKQRPVLTDFLIPCLLKHRYELGWVPNPTYLAPEQITANRAMPESDIYALGLLLYEMVTGDVPFKGKPQDIIEQHQTMKPIPPAQISVNMDPRIDAIVMKALNKQPMSRFSSVRDMLVALESDDIQSGFSTVSLDRKEMPETAKRASEIQRFRQARLADPDPLDAVGILADPPQQVLWIGAALLIILIVIALAVLFLV